MNTTVRDIYTFIDSIAPFDTQESREECELLEPVIRDVQAVLDTEPTPRRN